jgi:hypothetical protein
MFAEKILKSRGLRTHKKACKISFSSKSLALWLKLIHDALVILGSGQAAATASQ